MLPRVVLFVLLGLLAPFTVRASGCNQATREPLSYVRLPGEPFSALPSPDGCWIFVSLSTGKPGVAVLSRHDGAVTLERTIEVRGSPAGMSLTHDGKLLIVPSGSGVAFLDVERLTSGHKSPVLGYWSDLQDAPAQVYAGVTADDRFLFVTNEAAGSVAVLDLGRMRHSHFGTATVLGRVRVGSAPVGLAFSADGRNVFVTSQMMEDRGWPQVCRPEGRAAAAPDHTEGAVVVMDVQQVVRAPASAAIKVVRAGCNPVRVVASADGEHVYVTARGSDALLVFNEEQLTDERADAPAVSVSVGSSPVGLAVIDNGAKIVVANSNRFAAPDSHGQSLYVIDSKQVISGAVTTLGLLPAQAFPREIRSTADGRTLLVTNFIGRALEIVDLDRTPWQFTRRDEAEREAAADFLAFRASLDAQRSRYPLHLCSRVSERSIGSW